MPVEEFGDPTLSSPELSQLARLMRVATAPVVRYKAEGLEVSLQR
jgi:hypothetical protein